MGHKMGLKWSKRVQNWSKMIKNDLNWPKSGLEMAQNWNINCQIVQNWSKRGLKQFKIGLK